MLLCRIHIEKMNSATSSKSGAMSTNKHQKAIGLTHAFTRSSCGYNRIKYTKMEPCPRVTSWPHKNSRSGNQIKFYTPFLLGKWRVGYQPFRRHKTAPWKDLISFAISWICDKTDTISFQVRFRNRLYGNAYANNKFKSPIQSQWAVREVRFNMVAIL